MVVAGVAVAVGMLMTMFVMPTMQGLYTTLHAKVPAITQMLLAVGNLVRGNVLPILGTAAAIVIGTNLYSRSEAGKLQKDRWSLTLPMIGMINRLKELSYCCRTMAVLFKSGLTSTEVMDVVVDSSNNRLMKQALSDVKQGMLKGEGIAQPMADNKLFLPMMVQMVRVGEETGGLGDSLVVVADTYDADAAAKTKRFVRTVSTALTILITIMVGTIVMAMMMAMYGIYGQVKLG
jgi:type IV pilus assembly protein PilC